MKRVQQRTYIAFGATYGHGPWTCHFCRKEISSLGRGNGDALGIHHLDHDRTNDSPTNLVPAHNRCHQSYHLSLYWTDEARQARSVQSRKSWDKRSPESQRRSIEGMQRVKPRPPNADLTPEERSEVIWGKKSAEERTASAKKGWETRRKKNS